MFRLAHVSLSCFTCLILILTCVIFLLVHVSCSLLGHVSHLGSNTWCLPPCPRGTFLFRHVSPPRCSATCPCAIFLFGQVVPSGWETWHLAAYPRHFLIRDDSLVTRGLLFCPHVPFWFGHMSPHGFDTWHLQASPHATLARPHVASSFWHMSFFWLAACPS